MFHVTLNFPLFISKEYIEQYNFFRELHNESKNKIALLTIPIEILRYLEKYIYRPLPY